MQRIAALLLFSVQIIVHTACRTTDEPESSTKIFNGRVLTGKEHNETVLLALENTEPFDSCSGVALSDNTVVTSATCVLANLATGSVKAFQTDGVKPEMLGIDRTIHGVRNTAIKIN